ncbi:MAG: lytic transglycosylase domain-containing protein [Candidatus Saccharimonadales bacterium]
MANIEKATGGDVNHYLLGVMVHSGFDVSKGVQGIPEKMMKAVATTVSGGKPMNFQDTFKKVMEYGNTAKDEIENSPAVNAINKQIKVPEQYRGIINKSSSDYGVPEKILQNTLHQESKFHAGAVSHAGAEGIAQFMPDTARRMGVQAFNPESAIPGAAKYLSENYKKFGSWPKALAAYNWGEGNVEHWIARGSKISQMPAQTRDYIRSILGEKALEEMAQD